MLLPQDQFRPWRRKQSGQNTVTEMQLDRCPTGIIPATWRVLSSKRKTPPEPRRFFRRILQMSKPRISYIDPSTIKDPAMIAEFERCAREGTPRPESQAIRAHVPATFWSFANTWRDVFKNGVADHKIKELCRIYVSRSVL